MNSIRTKTCSKCESTLPISQFNADKKNKDGHCGRCKDCKRGERKPNFVSRPMLSTNQIDSYLIGDSAGSAQEFASHIKGDHLLYLLKELSSTRYFSIQVDKENVAIHTHEKNRSTCLRGELVNLGEMLQSML